MEQVERSTAPRSRVVVVIAALLVALSVTAAWWFTAAHPGMHLARTAGVEMCFVPSGTELVMGGLDFDPPAGATILAVRLVEPRNVEIADARLVPVVPGQDGGTNIPGFTAGWPLEDLGEYTVDWAADRELVGAHLRPGVPEAPYLHVHVVDPGLPASFESWQVEYRMRATRWVSTLTIAFRQPVAPETCEDVT